MKSLKMITIIMIVMFTVIGCGQADGPKTPKEVFQPDWYGIQDNVDYVFSYGKAEKRSEDMAFEAAKANAYLEAAQYVKSHVKGMIKNYMEEAGVDNPQITALTSKVVKVVSDAKFSNTMISQRKSYVAENGYLSFVRLSLPKAEINKNMLNQIKNEEALYNQFKSSQAFKELDNELAK